ncbi:MAG: hypothetical protein C7B44_12030, partial [Sulfobacillus thermosulfidooxidans]
MKHYILLVKRLVAVGGIIGMGIFGMTSPAFAKTKTGIKPPPHHVVVTGGMGGGTSTCKTSDVYVQPTFHLCAHTTPSQPPQSSKPLPSGGTGRLRSLPKTPHSVSIGTSPKKSPASPTKTTTKTTPK